LNTVASDTDTWEEAETQKQMQQALKKALILTIKSSRFAVSFLRKQPTAPCFHNFAMIRTYKYLN